MSNPNILVIHTETYSTKTMDILTRLKNRVLLGNASHKMTSNFMLANPEFEPNGEVVWSINTISVYGSRMYTSSSRTWHFCDSTYARKGKDPKKIREWLAVMLKEHVRGMLYNEADNSGMPWGQRSGWVEDNWNRDSTVVLHDISNAYVNTKKIDSVNLCGDITVAEVYCLYDILLNRKRLRKSYPKTLIETVIGSEKDPVATEFERIRREELSRLEEEHNDTLRLIEKERIAEINAFTEKINKHHGDRKEEEKTAYKNRLDSLKESMSFMQNL